MSYKILSPEEVSGEENLRKGWKERGEIMWFGPNEISVDDIINNDNKFNIGKLKIEGAYKLVPFKLPDDEVVALVMDLIDLTPDVPPQKYDNTIFDIQGNRVYNNKGHFVNFVEIENRAYAIRDDSKDGLTLLVGRDGNIIGKFPISIELYWIETAGSESRLDRYFKKIDGKWHLKWEDEDGNPILIDFDGRVYNI